MFMLPILLFRSEILLTYSSAFGGGYKTTAFCFEPAILVVRFPFSIFRLFS